MSYEAIEKQETLKRLADVEEAVKNFPGATTDYILNEVSLIDLAKMAEFVDYEMAIKFGPKSRFETLPDVVTFENKRDRPRQSHSAL